MNTIRVASLGFCVALVFATLPVAAQGPPSAPGPGNSLQTQVDALTAAVAALETALATEKTDRAAGDSTLQTNINSEASSRAATDAALDARVAKSEGNITAADLEGTYKFYFLGTAIDSGPNTITSFFITGTMTLGSGGIGEFVNTSTAGAQLTEQAPSANWVAAGGTSNGSYDGSLSWAYNNGVVTINAGGDINDLTPTAGGQVMVGVQGGPPGNTQAILVATRQPSN